MSLRLIHEDWTVASTLTDDEQTSVKITSKTNKQKKTKHHKHMTSHMTSCHTPHNMATETSLEYVFQRKTHQLK